MANVYAITNGNWSAGATWNTGVVPTSADDVFTNNFTVNMDVNATVISLRNTASAPIVAGGSFNFNTAGVTVSATSTSAALGIQPGTTFSTITATTGTVTLNVGSNINYGPSLSATLISNYSGACNFVFSGVNIIALNPGTGGLVRPFDKTSSGTITINANITTTTVASGSVNILTSSAGNTIINGNVTSGAGICINQSAGNPIGGSSETIREDT